MRPPRNLGLDSNPSARDCPAAIAAAPRKSARRNGDPSIAQASSAPNSGFIRWQAEAQPSGEVAGRPSVAARKRELSPDRLDPKGTKPELARWTMMR